MGFWCCTLWTDPAPLSHRRLTIETSVNVQPGGAHFDENTVVACSLPHYSENESSFVFEQSFAHELLIREVRICFQLYRTKSYHISQLLIMSKPAELAYCAVKVVLHFWDAAAFWEAFRWDHCDDETPPAWTANSLKLLWVTTAHSGGCNSRQEHYADREWEKGNGFTCGGLRQVLSPFPSWLILLY